MVASAGQKFRQRIFASQPVMVADDRFRLLQPVMDAYLRRGAPGYEAGARGGADWTRSEGVGEASSLIGDAVQIRCWQFAIAVAPVSPLAVIVGKEEKDIGAIHIGVLVKSSGLLEVLKLIVWQL